MIFGKHINRYYLKYGIFLLIGIITLGAVDYLQLIIPRLYQMTVNGINQGYIIENGRQIAFDMPFLLDRICMPIGQDLHAHGGGDSVAGVRSVFVAHLLF